MLREFQTILDKNVDSTYKAEVAMKTGMGVLKDFANKTAEFPAAETAEGIFLVDKERVPTGTDCARGDMSDYDKAFTDVAANEFVKLPTYVAGEAFGTDQFVSAGLTAGNRVAVGTDGKWKKAGASISSRYVYTGIHSDAGNTLARIEVAGEAKVNA